MARPVGEGQDGADRRRAVHHDVGSTVEAVEGGEAQRHHPASLPSAALRHVLASTSRFRGIPPGGRNGQG